MALHFRTRYKSNMTVGYIRRKQQVGYPMYSRVGPADYVCDMDVAFAYLTPIAVLDTRKHIPFGGIPCLRAMSFPSLLNFERNN